ncbi:hypothetical protein [Quadrisphaera sp. INWT6]|uniref:hypothetical protein n=1 Tax=Quadrisphaera sp. INWT6 TaxID=2596917 RepID=UPI001CA55553|nr:hypothetical protein [Quadrisphaera sp. INWT6]
MATWTWTFEDADGQPVLPETLGGPAAPPEGFSAQADAETWVGEHWRALLAAGAEGAVLSEDERRVYGPMPLRPAE